MQTDILIIADTLSDDELLARLPVLARNEREASAELVAHLAVLDTRPALYAADGYGSLFSYCTRALALSEDAACNPIEAARACRQFPCLLERLAAGALSLTSLRLLGRHLTAENHRAVLSRAEYKSRREIEALVAELAPRADAPSLIRRLPAAPVEAKAAPGPSQEPTRADEAVVTFALPTPRPAPRPIVEPLAPKRYGLHCTIDEETQDGLRRLQSLLRREIPDGDLGAILKQAVADLVEKVERKKLAKTERPRPQRAIRPGTDKDAAEGPLPPRHPPRAVKRAVWARDRGRCAYVSPKGRRCEERTFLEFHHRLPYAKRGEATVDNIALRCRRHNQYEAELVFGDPAGGTRSRPRAEVGP
jgi:5-methylcytosine-specific restriction endonuclease McrA